MIRNRLPRLLLAASVVVAMGVTACSDDDGAEPSDAATAGPVADGTGVGDRSDAGSATNDERSAGAESSENPTTFGYRVDGEPGTTVLVQTVAETEAGEQELSQTWSITDEPRWMLYSDWVTGGEISLELTEGEAATVEVLRGHAVDPENPFAGLEVVEVLETVDVTAGDPVTVTFPPG